MTVYSNSNCNIAATGAADGTRGLFFTRDDGDVDPVIIKLPEVDEKSGANTDAETISLVRTVFQNMKITAGDRELTPGRFEVFYFTDSDVWTNGVPESPLGKRAWCLQERVLSPRTVHFGEKQLLFECQSMHACSRFPEGIPPILIPSQECKSNLSLRNAAKQARSDDLASIEHVYNIWKNIVMTYSTCSLTFGKDKLVAISGMASYMEKNLHLSNYLAGIWSYRALDQLLWYSVSGASLDALSCFRPETYQAPSWSWASVNNPIKFSTPRRQRLARVVDGTIWPKGTDNRHGEVTYGLLVLHGVLITSRAYRQLKPIPPSSASFITVLRLGESQPFLEPVFDDWKDSRSDKYACAPLAFTDNGVAGLVLLQAEATEIVTEGVPVYRRAGFFSASKDDWSRFMGRPVKVPYRVERTASGSLVQVWPNEVPKEPDFDDEDKEWAEKHAVEFLII